MNKQEHAFSHWLFTIIAAFFLTACGGGGNSLLDLQGVSTYKLGVTTTSSTLGPSSNALISATLQDSSGVAVSGKTIRFSSTGPGALSATSAVTDASGIASVTLNGNGSAGTGVVKATFTDSSNNVVANGINYSVIDGDNIALTLNKNTVKSGNGDSVTLTAFVTNSSGNIQPGKAVSFSVSGSSSGSISVANAGITDAHGLVTATYSPDMTDRSNKAVVVNASSVATPAITASGTINVIGTTINLTASPTATTLGSSINLDGTLMDGNGAAIGSQAITLTSPNFAGGQVILTTDSSGKIPTQVVVITNAPGGTATFTGAGLGATGSTSVSVSGTSFSFNTGAPAPSEEIVVSTPKTVTITYLNGAVPVSGQTVFFSTSLGTMTPSSAVTDVSGQASSALSSTSAGQAVVSANTAGAALQASRDVLFVGGTPTQIAIQAGQTTLAPLAQTQITATVRDASGNPVKGKVVVFNVIDDPSFGAGLSSSLATTNNIGQASVSYTAGALTTATNSIKIRASVQGTAVTTQPFVAPLDAQLTVGGQAVFISIGSGNTISDLDSTTYADPHNVVITDATGAPIANQVVTLSIIPMDYHKGQYVKTGSGWAASWSVTCANEDTNSDGVIQPGEDINGNGKLDPGNPVTLSSATVTTGSNGFASFSVLYGKNYGNWLFVRLRVTTKVNGTESKAELFYDLSVSAADVANESASPPGGVYSPFGNTDACNNPN